MAAGVSHCGELANEMAIRGINVTRAGSDGQNRATGTLLTSRSTSFSGGSQATQLTFYATSIGGQAKQVFWCHAEEMAERN